MKTIILTLSTILLISCSKTADEVKPEPEVIVPVKPWVNPLYGTWKGTKVMTGVLDKLTGRPKPDVTEYSYEFEIRRGFYDPGFGAFIPDTNTLLFEFPREKTIEVPANVGYPSPGVPLVSPGYYYQVFRDVDSGLYKDSLITTYEVRIFSTTNGTKIHYLNTWVRKGKYNLTKTITIEAYKFQ